MLRLNNEWVGAWCIHTHATRTLRTVIIRCRYYRDIWCWDDTVIHCYPAEKACDSLLPITLIARVVTIHQVVFNFLCALHTCTHAYTPVHMNTHMCTWIHTCTHISHNFLHMYVCHNTVMKKACIVVLKMSLISANRNVHEKHHRMPVLHPSQRMGTCHNHFTCLKCCRKSSFMKPVFLPLQYLNQGPLSFESGAHTSWPPLH